AKPGGKVPNQTCLVEVRWPSEFPEQLGFDAFVDWVSKLGEMVPYRSGYASPALSRGWEDLSHLQEGARHMGPPALRHPGYDLPENDATASFMGKDQCRGARWLTLLGPALVEQLGGQEQMKKQLDAGVTIAKSGAGLLLRAGAKPEIGDVNRGDVTP